MLKEVMVHSMVKSMIGREHGHREGQAECRRFSVIGGSTSPRLPGCEAASWFPLWIDVSEIPRCLATASQERGAKRDGSYPLRRYGDRLADHGKTTVIEAADSLEARVKLDGCPPRQGCQKRVR